MRSLLFILICGAAHAAPICTPLGNGVTECSYYGIIQNSAPKDNRKLYMEIAPVGESRPLRIVHAMVHSFLAMGGYSGQHVLLVESPAHSNWWKVPLAWSHEGTGDSYSRNSFWPGVTLGPGDALCLQKYSNYGASYAVQYLIGP